MSTRISQERRLTWAWSYWARTVHRAACVISAVLDRSSAVHTMCSSWRATGRWAVSVDWRSGTTTAARRPAGICRQSSSEICRPTTIITSPPARGWRCRRLEITARSRRNCVVSVWENSPSHNLLAAAKIPGNYYTLSRSVLLRFANLNVTVSK